MLSHSLNSLVFRAVFRRARADKKNRLYFRGYGGTGHVRSPQPWSLPCKRTHSQVGHWVGALLFGKK
jgi:hypothetical protein